MLRTKYLKRMCY